MYPVPRRHIVFLGHLGAHVGIDISFDSLYDSLGGSLLDKIFLFGLFWFPSFSAEDKREARNHLTRVNGVCAS